MDWKDILDDGYSRIPGYVAHILAGLGFQDLTWRPRPDCNSIGWLVWHLTRQQDAQVSVLMGEEQLWIKEIWHQKFNRPPDPGDTGFGDSPGDAAAFAPPENSVVLEYLRAVVRRTIEYFRQLSEKDLDRKLDEPRFQPLPTVGIRLISILEDCNIHAGQAAYVRGLRQGKGWQKY